MNDAQITPPKETDGALLARLGMDGKLWAEEFCKRFPAVPEDEAIGWFANAIMAGYDNAVRKHSVDYWRSIAIALGASE